MDTERRRAPREPSSEQPPASQSLEGRTDRNVAPEQQQGSTEGSSIVYAEEEPTESRESERRRPDSEGPSEESQEGPPSVFSEELMEELESVQAAEEGTANGDVEGGDGTATGTSTVRTEEGGQVVYALEGENSTRELERYSLPQLSQEELSGLPGRVEVVVSFTLPPNGRPMDLQIERSSGRIPVDVKVERAVQTWEFSDAPRDAESVKGGARIIIRAVD
ncbi:MAG: TonB family protein [Spirochaetia bacterium]|nr:TonB family protein [Spirochaetia bacterium]